MNAASEQRRLAYLRRLGIDVWVPRATALVATGPVAAAESVESDQRPAAAETAARPAPVVEAPEMSRPTEPAPSRPAAPPPAVEAAAVPPRAAETTPAPAPSPAVIPSDVGWPELRERVAACRACGLCETRTQTVFGVGSVQAPLMVVGEAPGAEEDRQGEPFVGPAGKLLDAMLQAMGWPRERVYIANILKCRPHHNRDPLPQEVAACEPYLKAQLERVAPRVILAVGRIAAQNLLKTDQPLARLRGVVHRYGDTPVIVTYHPAYLLRSPAEKARAWQDLKAARALVEAEAPR